MKKKFLLSILIVILAGAVIFQFWGPYANREKAKIPDFYRYIPSSMDDWVVEDRPIAESPEMQEIVEGILRYDAAIYRTYKKGAVEISVYLAYWQPGKVHREAVDTHTPDICWVANGWTMKKLPGLGQYKTREGTVGIPNYRKFDAHGFDLTVLYWHIEGSQLLRSHSVEDSKQGAGERIIQRISQVWQTISAKPEDQLFVRVSSNGDIAGQLELPPVAAVLDLVAVKTLKTNIQ